MEEQTLDEATADPTGGVLVSAWEGRHHHKVPDACGVCGGTVWKVGITKLAYTHEVCNCGEPEFSHLVETLWHRACLEPTRCDQFRPFYVKARRGQKARVTKECVDCGRPERAHR